MFIVQVVIIRDKIYRYCLNQRSSSPITSNHNHQQLKNNHTYHSKIVTQMDNNSGQQKSIPSFFSKLFGGSEAPKEQIDPNDIYNTYINGDKYADLLDNPEILSARQKKWRKLTSKLGEAKSNAIQGAMMGSMVGGLFGFAVGIYSAVHTRRLISIPISVIVSGASFGFIMGCGSLVRTTDQVPEQYVEGWRQTVQYNNRQKE